MHKKNHIQNKCATKQKRIETLKYYNKMYKKVKIDDSEVKFWREELKLFRNYRFREFKCHKCIIGFRNEKKYLCHNKKLHSEVSFD